jgi:hypothetical protein
VATQALGCDKHGTQPELGRSVYSTGISQNRPRQRSGFPRPLPLPTGQPALGRVGRFGRKQPADSGHHRQLPNPSAVRCSHTWQRTFARQSRQQEAVVGSALIRRNLNYSGLSPFLDNIPHRGVIRKQRQHRLAIPLKRRSCLVSYPETRESLVKCCKDHVPWQSKISDLRSFSSLEKVPRIFLHTRKCGTLFGILHKYVFDSRHP